MGVSGGGYDLGLSDRVGKKPSLGECVCQGCLVMVYCPLNEYECRWFRCERPMLAPCLKYPSMFMCRLLSRLYNWCKEPRIYPTPR